MKVALLLIDSQVDFFERPGLAPEPGRLRAQMADLLGRWRAAGLPVLHVHTRVRPDGSDRMPHWIETGTLDCLDGSVGASAPPELAPLATEPLFYKRFFDAFGAPGLRETLAGQQLECLVLAGLYLHACIRSTALSAYESGLQVWVAEDAVGSTEPMHAALTRQWLDGRAARFAPSTELLALFAPTRAALQVGHGPLLPVACVGTDWHVAETVSVLVHRAPANDREVLMRVPEAGAGLIGAATAAARDAGPAWRASSVGSRLVLLQHWCEGLRRQTAELLHLMIEDIGKPLNDAREELQRGLAHIEACARIAQERVELARGVDLRRQPLGCVALITPWNNPVAIPLGKLAPALVFGNTVVWKPAPEAARIAIHILQLLHAAGLPSGVVNLVQGGARTGSLLIADPGVHAVSLTGAIASGRSAQALCTLYGKPLQAELGGNNACIVLADAVTADGIDTLAAGLARAAFSYSGQRCTAIRRLVVERSVVAPFTAALVAAVRALPLGEAAEHTTVIGPLVSASQLQRTAAAVDQALAGGARVLCGGQRPEGWSHGYWYEPTLIDQLAPEAALVQQETFGPVALIQTANDLEHAIALANGVPQGLLAALVSRDPVAQQRCREQLEVGILKLASGPLALHPDAPFGGLEGFRDRPTRTWRLGS